MKNILLLISGCRHYRNYFKFAKEVDRLIANWVKKGYHITLVEGGANGTDYLAFIYAKRRKFSCITVPADWDEYGKSAGYRRNVEMMEMVKHGIAFWDGKSRGTRHVIENANRYNVSLKIVKIPEGNKHVKPKSRNRLRSESIR